jgi:nucleotide-binding universal stress UspA family protein
MTAFRKILVPIDFSKHSDRALETAVDLARKYDAAVTVMHVYVIPTVPLPEGYIVAGPDQITEILNKTKDALDGARKRVVAMGAAKVDTLMAEGVAFTEIVRVAREKGYDLIVMGTHGRTGLKHALMGSVAEKVVRKAPCAVLTTRDAAQEFVAP